jgi:diaminohydroxyphosphoribosylaminopyrimidine deaminase / 5-amino-6-(5-phosphoribosylamino)uracil reductase
MNPFSLDEPLESYGSGAFDRAIMQRCVMLAQKALGRTAPNPMVGAVVVREGRIIGEGFHPGAGQPHAEVFALREAGDAAMGAIVYVSLEPCNHYGRTPPCSEALVTAGVAKVVVGTVDPNPKVAGRGIARLRAAGIEVVVGVEEEACREVNEAFFFRMQYHRPFGILKYAMTLDGKIATATGHSTWVTGDAARSQVHHLRSACDAVIVGGNTMRRDNPRLTSHDPNAHNPLRVVMTRTLDLPAEAKLWHVEEAPTLVCTQVGANLALQQQLRDRGVEVMEFETLTPARVMEGLNDRGVLSVLWECGGTLAAEAISDRVVQKAIVFIAPKIIGGRSAPSPVGDLGLTQMTDALMLERVRWRTVGLDFAIEGYMNYPQLASPELWVSTSSYS